MSGVRRFALQCVVGCAIATMLGTGCGRYGPPVRSQPQRAASQDQGVDEQADQQAADEARRREEAAALIEEGIAP